MDFLSQFLDAMRSKGCEPAAGYSIIADDKRHRYRLNEAKARGETNASYQLKIEGDFAVGWFRSFREGKTHKFTSNLDKKTSYTPEQKAEWKKNRDAAMKEQAHRIAEEHAQAAKKANAIWDKADKSGITPYLQKKDAGLNGARIYRDMVCVPIKINGKLTSLQFIAPEGGKRFITGSELVGGYFGIAHKDDDLSRMAICEGFATGDAIRKSTGMVTIVAFNAGNLKPVAMAIRKKYPEAAIIIAADNDQWTKKPTGEPWNTGIDYATQAAEAVGGARVVWPIFEEADLKNKPTDFNDALLLYGSEWVKDKVTAAQKEESGDTYGVGALDSSLAVDVQTSDPHPTTGDDEGEYGHISPEPPTHSYEDDVPALRNLPSVSDWRSLLIANKDGIPKSSSLRNAILFTQFHDDFKGVFAYNEFHQNIMIVRCPPWAREEDFKPSRLDDITITNCSAELERWGINVGTDKVFKAIQAVAMSAAFHPAREYFKGLKWDGNERLGRWLTYYLGCESESGDYLAFVGTKWLVAAVRRVFMPGCKFDHVLVIEGDQGLGKSTALKVLATFGDEHGEESYFTDAVTIGDIQQKDTIMKIQGSIIVELSELSGFGKKEDEEIKRWITLQHDDVRLPYGRETSRFERQFVLAATTNRHDYLKDPTGNRRYWPVLAGKRIDMEALKRDRSQLWAEAYYHYSQSLYIGPTRDEERLANIEREKRLATDSWTDTVMNHAEDLRLAKMGRGFKISDVMGEMGLPLRDRDDRAQRRIANILQINGYENRSVWSPVAKRTERFWMKVEATNE